MTATLTPQGTDTQTTKKKRKPLMITLISLIVIAPFVLNAIIINGFTPTSVRGGDPTSFYAQYGGISVYQATNLTSGGIGSLSIKSDGYVNLLKEGRDIYINKDITDKSISVRTSFLYRHEIAHVDQKELVANKAGGYPTWSKPVLTIKYFYYLYKLDSDYQKIMPGIVEGHEGFVPFPGLEAAADCRAMPMKDGWGKENGGSTYTDSTTCSYTHKKVSISAMSGKWPTEDLFAQYLKDTQAHKM